MIWGSHRELLETPETVFSEVAGMQEDNGGGGVCIDVLVAIAMSLLALGIAVGECVALEVLLRAIMIYSNIYSFDLKIGQVKQIFKNSTFNM